MASSQASPLHDVSNATPQRDRSTEACGKQAHSPWSAPRQKKRNKASEVDMLAIIAEHDAVSPPKMSRRNGGDSLAARDLHMLLQHQQSMAAAAAPDAGPLAQGVLAGELAETVSFSPLATGLAASFAMGAAAPVPDALGGHHRSRLHATSGSSSSHHPSRMDSRMVVGRQHSRLGVSPPSQLPLIDLEAPDCPGSLFAQQQLHQQQVSMNGWHWGAATGTDGRAPAPPQGQAAQQAAEQQEEQHQIAECGPRAEAPQQQQQQDVHPFNFHVRPMSQATGRTNPSRASGGDMDHDLRSSWGSERSAEGTKPWEAMRHGGVLSLAEQYLRRPSSAALRASGDSVGAGLRHSTESLGSLDGGPSVSERQVSILPLRTALHGSGGSSSQLSSPAPLSATGGTPGRGRLLGFGRPGSMGGSGQPRRSCFSCASPFTGCRGGSRTGAGAVDGSEDEVVRRNVSSDAGEFVIHTKCLPPSADKLDAYIDEVECSTGRPQLRKASLNQPPPSPGELVPRQCGFSARCGGTPSGWSPRTKRGAGASEASSACTSTSSLPGTGGAAAVGHHCVEEMLSALKSSEAPSVDMLNDMLKSFCTLDAHPRDAEDLVQEACKQGGVVPNAATLRTLDKIWAAHEQLNADPY